MTATVDLKVGPVAGGALDDYVKVDGHDITRAVAAIGFNARVGEKTSLTLDLAIQKGVSFVGEARVRVSDETAAAMLALGWTPPPSEPQVVRFWIATHRDLLDQAEVFPANWQLLRVLEFPHDTLGRCLVEILDTAAPAEAEGLVLEPTIQRHADGTVTVMDYNLPKPPADRSDEIEVSVPAGAWDLGDPQIRAVVLDAARRQAAERDRHVVDEPTYIGVGHRDDVLMHHWRFKTRALAADEANPVLTSEDSEE